MVIWTGPIGALLHPELVGAGKFVQYILYYSTNLD